MGLDIYEIKQKAIYLLLSLKIDSYPIDVFDIINKLDDCNILTFSDYSKRANISLVDTIRHLGSHDAAILKSFKKNKFMIFYNENIETLERIRWSIAHEIGHYILGHLNDNNCQMSRGLDDKIYDRCENEANFFAAELLSNLYILYKLDVKNYQSISSLCGLSIQASKNRYKTYKKWLFKKPHSKEDKLIYYMFKKKIDSKCCCSICHTQHNKDTTYKYCNICGSKLNLMEGDIMKYKKFELNENNKLTECIRCGNEDNLEDANYCKICGAPLINKCTNYEGISEVNGYGNPYYEKEPCGKIAEGNARYCIYCGEETTFYKSQLLDKWHIEKEKIEYNANNSNSNGYNNVQIEYDDIPF